MEAFITALSTVVTGAALWAALAPAASIVAVGVIFGFSYKVLRRVVGGIQTGKAKI